MNRRGFLKGLLGVVAAAALPVGALLGPLAGERRRFRRIMTGLPSVTFRRLNVGVSPQAAAMKDIADLSRQAMEAAPRPWFTLEPKDREATDVERAWLDAVRDEGKTC